MSVEGIDKLFCWEDAFGRDFTLEDPCGLWCSIGDWAKWVGTLEHAAQQTELALVDLRKTGSRTFPPLNQRFETWKIAWDDEPQTISQLGEMSAYKGNSKVALERLVELGKQLRNLLRDINSALKHAGAVSKIPGSTTDKGRGGMGLGDIPWWGWVAGGYLAWDQLIRKKQPQA